MECREISELDENSGKDSMRYTDKRLPQARLDNIVAAMIGSSRTKGQNETDYTGQSIY